ncbi:MAG: hypothetical protein EXX96DRAFT_569571 [Benjaminiella poitrasii]|nr:MAG: hypothetical protein EXX96DRAFT_569571 [Benjaminiella poitrasii]
MYSNQIPLRIISPSVLLLLWTLYSVSKFLLLLFVNSTHITYKYGLVTLMTRIAFMLKFNRSTLRVSQMMY